MLNRATFTLMLTLVLAAAHGQEYQITGQVLDESGNPVPFANAALFNADSTLVTGAVSDDGGKFAIQARDGKYSLRVTFLSYEDKVVPLAVAGKNVSLGIIRLSASSQVLESVTVEGERSQMELYLDKRVFQVGKDLSNISGSAAEILDNVPSVAVDVEGNISLRGSQNVRILIDGKPSGLAGISTADALRQLQGNLIERVEVITNPSARFDAEGEVGIINIILKKENKQGVNGSFTLNTGYPKNHGASFNLNFRRERFNFFTSYGFSYRSNPGSGFSFQRFTEPDTTFSYRQQNERTRSGFSHTVRGGLDYYLTEKSVLTASALVRRSDGKNTSLNRYTDIDSEGDIVRTILRDEHEDEPEWNSELALSYRREYDKKGQLLTADFKWIENIETEKARFTETNVTEDSVGFQRTSNTEDERNILAQIDYTHPIGDKGKYEAGLKSTIRVIDNDFLLEERADESNVWTIRPELNNNLIYTENIHAAYFIIGNETGRFSWQMGVRGELSDISVRLRRTSETTYQNYFNVFPSAHLSYKLRGENAVQLSYSYRLSRPRFRDLMPFSNYSDNRSVPVGNPYLRPEFTHSTEAGYLANWKSGSLLSSVYYRYRTGVIERMPVVDSVGFTSLIPVNLGTENAFGVEVNLSYNPFAWARLNTNANFYRAITEGQFEGQRRFADTYTWTSRTTAKFTILKKWDFQTGYNYRGPRQTPLGREYSMQFIDLGLSRDILRGNGTITASVRDLLNSRRFRSVISQSDYYSEREFQWRARQFLVTFTYRLNKAKENRSREGGGDGGDEFEGGE